MSSICANGSWAAFDFHCDLCDKDNNYVEAMGYCVNCVDYLCQDCFNNHHQAQRSQNHVLLDQHKMPKVTSQRKDMCIEPCATHKHDTLQYFCADHDEFGCSVCMTLHHRNCEGVDYIPDIAKNVFTSREYEDMILKVKYLTEKAQQAINTTQSKSKITNQQHLSAIKLRKELESAVDRLETSIMNVAGKIREENQKKIKYVEDQYNKLLKDIKALDSKFTSLENKGDHCQIFLSMKRSQDEIAAIETSLLQLQDKGNITEYEIKMNDDLQHLIKQPENMASLEIINNPSTSPSQVAPNGLISQTKTRQEEDTGHTLVKNKSSGEKQVKKISLVKNKSSGENK